MDLPARLPPKRSFSAIGLNPNMLREPTPASRRIRSLPLPTETESLPVPGLIRLSPSPALRLSSPRSVYVWLLPSPAVTKSLPLPACDAVVA